MKFLSVFSVLLIGGALGGSPHRGPKGPGRSDPNSIENVHGQIDSAGEGICALPSLVSGHQSFDIPAAASLNGHFEQDNIGRFVDKADGQITNFPEDIQRRSLNLQIDMLQYQVNSLKKWQPEAGEASLDYSVSAANKILDELKKIIATHEQLFNQTGLRNGDTQASHVMAKRDAPPESHSTINDKDTMRTLISILEHLARKGESSSSSFSGDKIATIIITAINTLVTLLNFLKPAIKKMGCYKSLTRKLGWDEENDLTATKASVDDLKKALNKRCDGLSASIKAFDNRVKSVNRRLAKKSATNFNHSDGVDKAVEQVLTTLSNRNNELEKLCSDFKELVGV